MYFLLASHWHTQWPVSTTDGCAWQSKVLKGDWGELGHAWPHFPLHGWAAAACRCRANLCVRVLQLWWYPISGKGSAPSPGDIAVPDQHLVPNPPETQGCRELLAELPARSHLHSTKVLLEPRRDTNFGYFWAPSTGVLSVFYLFAH